MKKRSQDGDTLVFIFAAREMSLERTKVHSSEGWIEFANRFKDKTEADILNALFVNKDDNPYKRSGFYPYKLVTANLWIR